MMSRDLQVGDVVTSERFRFRGPGNSYVRDQFTSEYGNDLELLSVGLCRPDKEGRLIIEGSSDNSDVSDRGVAEYRVISVEDRKGGFDGHSPRQSSPDGRLVTALLISPEVNHSELIQFNLNPGFRDHIGVEDLNLVSE